MIFYAAKFCTLEKEDLNLKEALILSLLSDFVLCNLEQKISFSMLGKAIKDNKATVEKTLNSLIQKGYIKITSSTKDEIEFQITKSWGDENFLRT